MPKPKKNEAKQDFLKRCTGELVDTEGKDADQAYALCNAYWHDAHNQRAALNFSAPLTLLAPEPPETDGDDGDKDRKAKFLITAYTGQVIDRGWWGKLVIDTKGIKTKAKLPILREHARDRVVGYSTKTWKDNHSLFIQGEFSQATEDAAQVLALADEGFPWEASIGVWPKKVKMLDSDKEEITVNGQKLTGPLEIWTEAEVRETSFVALGADDGTAAINFADTFADDGKFVKVQIERGNPVISQEVNRMPISLEQLAQEAPELLQEIRDAARQEGLQGERQRVVTILQAEGPAALTLELVQTGASVEAALQQFLAALKAGKMEALEAMKAAAPPALGQAAPPLAPGDDELPAEQVLDRKARELARQEGLSLRDAQIKIIERDPDLARRYYGDLGVN